MPTLSTLVTSRPYVFYNRSIGLIYSAGLPCMNPKNEVKVELVLGLKTWRYLE